MAKRGHAFLLQPPVTQAPSQHTSGGQGEGDPSEGEGQQAEGAGDTQAGSHQSQGQGTAVCYVPPYVLVARAKGLAAEVSEAKCGRHTHAQYGLSSVENRDMPFQGDGKKLVGVALLQGRNRGCDDPLVAVTESM